MLRSAVLGALLLSATPALAGPFDPPRCENVPGCVKLAEETPDKFTPTLQGELPKLSGAKLIDGLKYKHPRAEVDAIVQHQIHVALTKADGHTSKSATALLSLAQSEDHRRWRSDWIDLLAQDAAGRQVLVAFIDRAKKGDGLRFNALADYVEHAGRPTPSELNDLFRSGTFDWDAPPKVPPEVQPILARYVDELWTVYVENRAFPDRFEVGRVQGLLHRRPEFVERLAALVRADVEAGSLPRREELSALASHAKQHSNLTRELLQWAASENQPLRRLVAHEIKDRLDARAFSREQIPLVRRVLIAGAMDQLDPKREEFLFELDEFLDGMSDEEATQIARMVKESKEIRSWEGDRILLRVAEAHQELREAYIQRLVNGSYEEAERLIGQRDRPPDWMQAFAVSWIASQTAELLKDEAIQERMLVFLRMLKRELSYLFPESRRPRKEDNSICYTGVLMHQAAARQEAHDLKALGQPVPESVVEAQKLRVPNARPEKVIVAPPMSPQEATVRWQQFVMARESVLRAMAKEQRK